MADTCLAAANPTGCGHYTLTVTIAGVPVSLQVSESDLLEPLTVEEREQAARWVVRLARQAGLPLAQFVGRVVRGDEATNVKAYTLFGPGVAVTRTNIGVQYVNVLNEANGGRSLVEFTGCTEFRAILNATLAQTGPYQVRIVRDSDDQVLYESPSIAAQAGSRELDTGWQPLPEWAAGLDLVRVQARSNTATDDPQFQRCVVVVR